MRLDGHGKDESKHPDAQGPAVPPLRALAHADTEIVAEGGKQKEISIAQGGRCAGVRLLVAQRLVDLLVGSRQSEKIFLRVIHENRAMAVYPRIEEKSGEKSGRDKDNGEFVAHKGIVHGSTPEAKSGGLRDLETKRLKD